MALLEGIVILILAVIVAVVLYWFLRNAISLVVNAIVGVLLLFIANIFLQPDIPINIITVLISAIGGIVGVALILLLYFAGISLEI
ncbi:MAG: pro-sigmaK processing inhibitor BofA family protein [Methanomicrobiales archaeon]|nr:pro-sigmaK processing inhibitor BofA family protein [Methanomicrobiales archaeon]MDI6877010.1 pro-sigmaK processing inhibitor BofA family protein [Methanomicrobiales archaeon]